jgi:pyrroloquinoline quinone biosynthesis protein B
MRIKILGSAAGGGFPQWNCGCRNCNGVRDGSIRARPRTQTQIALEANPEYTLRTHWTLIGASPDLRSQIVADPDLRPFRHTNSSTPIYDVFLTSADVDSLMGLLHLREFQTFKIFSLPAVRRILAEENSIFRVLARAQPAVQWFSIPLASHAAWPKPLESHEPPRLICRAVSLGGEYPDFVGEKLRRELPPEEAVVGLALEYREKRLFIAPSLSGRNPEWKKWVESCDLVLIDGTFWSDDELVQQGRGKKTARQMGHLPLAGPAGLLEQYPYESRARKILIHINNTNPILDEESAQHRAVLAAGFEIAYDGMELTL